MQNLRNVSLADGGLTGFYDLLSQVKGMQLKISRNRGKQKIKRGNLSMEENTNINPAAQESTAELKKERAEEATHRQNVEEYNKQAALIEKKQLKYQKLSFLMSMLSAIFTGGMLIVVVGFVMFAVPKINTIYDSTMVSLKNLEQLTTELNEADLGGTVENLNNLTIQATSDLSSSMERLNSVDLETLNEAIVNLNATVEPLARFFGK